MLHGEPIHVTGTADPPSCAIAAWPMFPKTASTWVWCSSSMSSENSILGYHDDPKYLNGMFLNIAAIRKDAAEKIEKYDIRPPNPG
jgi:ABC-type uncharacterized transport system ATPase subunit